MPVPVPQQRVAPTSEATHVAHLTLLVIEDDPAGTFTVPELPAAAGTRVRIRTARNLTEAGRLLTDDVDCILLDLALPPSSEARVDEEPTGPRSSRPSSTSCASHRATPSSRSPRRTTPSWPPRRFASAPRTTSSAASSTGGC